jgi:hypothetical protein
VWALAATTALALQLLALTVAVMFGAVPDDVLYSYGPLGVMTTILLWFAKGTTDRLVKDRDRANEQRDAVVDDMLTRVMPTIQRSAEVLERRQQLDQDILRTLEDVRRLLE